MAKSGNRNSSEFKQVREELHPLHSSTPTGDDETLFEDDQAADSAQQLRVGAKFGRYLLKKELGRGAMGVVYLAHDDQLDRLVAMKVPAFDNRSSVGIARFYREARAMATISHPNLCPVYDVAEVDGIHFLTMKYVEGRPLSDYLKRGKSHPPKHAAVILRKLALALEEAHRGGIVHRDLKPANIMISARNEPVIMDFGLACRDSDNETSLTQTGQFLGTPLYMSPEQVKGNQSLVGPASDVYALGVIGYQMLVGRTPFDGSLGEVMASILTETPTRPSHIDAKIDRMIEAICLKAMEKRIEERYASASELADALQDYSHGGSPALVGPKAESNVLESATAATASLAAEEAAMATTTEMSAVEQDVRAPESPRHRSASRIAVGVFVAIVGLIACVLALPFLGSSPDQANERGSRPTLPTGVMASGVEDAEPKNVGEQPKSADTQSNIAGAADEGWFDLIPHINPKLDKLIWNEHTGVGNWVIEDNQLTIKTANGQGEMLYFPARVVAKSFEFEAEFTRLEGSRGFSFGIPCHDTACLILFDYTVPGKVTINEAPTFALNWAIKSHTRQRIRFRVDRGSSDDGIEIWVDDVSLGRLPGNIDDMVPNRGSKNSFSKRIALRMTEDATYVFHTIRVRPLDNTSVSLVRAASPSTEKSR